jgi:glycosyltransferase involved in cell wall biosynthesis
VTNSDEIEQGLKCLLWGDDGNILSYNYDIGSVKVHTTTPLRHHSYIPWANPFGSKLFGLGTSAIEKHGCDLLIGWYFQPYGLIAAQLGHNYDIPVIIIHAGSDIGRLAKHPDLAKSYEWMLSQAKVIITRGGRAVDSALDNLNGRREKRAYPHSQHLPTIYSKCKEPLNMADLLPRLPEWYRKYGVSQELIEGIIQLNEKEIDYEKPIVGIYGKVGEYKGNYELLEALDIVAKRGSNFNFICISGSSALGLEKYYKTLLEKRELKNKTRVLPMIAPWRIPSFLRLCNIVCFLERDFPISLHGPRIPREILASGACLVCSQEIVEKQSFKDSLVDGNAGKTVMTPHRIYHKGVTVGAY